MICSKHRQTYKLDRDKWTTYKNLGQMYTHVYEKMENTGIVEKLEVPRWQTEAGEDCAEENTFGYKVTHRF